MNRRTGLLLLAALATSGCAPTQRAAVNQPPAAPPPGQMVPVTPDPPRASNPPQPSPAPQPAPAAPEPAPSTEAGPPATSTPAPPASAPVKPRPAATTSRPPSASTKPTAAAPASSVRSAPPAAAPTPPPKPAAATLDLGALEQRLRDTKAIGVFTKLSLKNQVDDLLDEVRQYHQSVGKAPSSAIRQQFEGLMLKVLAALQNGDPQLADAIASSREALWGILMDPVKFSKIG